MPTVSPTQRYALLIGVGDYSGYDASTSQPHGTSDLAGATHDVASMYALAIALEIPPENIRVLLSPANGEDPAVALTDALSHATPRSIGPATNGAIIDGCKWLADALADGADANGHPAALVSYSGHGDFVDGHLALCPTDVRSIAAGSDLESALAYSTLGALFSTESKRNVTVVLDCCHAAAAVAKSRGRSSLTGRGRTATGPVATISDRTIAAAGVGDESEQSVFDGRAHGALTWAIKVVTDQWALGRSTGGAELTLDYDTLIKYVNRLLEALNFTQRASLGALPGLGSLPFFHRGKDLSDPLSATPNRARHGGQLEPDRNHDYTKYTITVVDSNGTLLTANALSVNKPQTYGAHVYAADTEHLDIDATNAAQWKLLASGKLSATSVTFTATGESWPSTDPAPNATELGSSSVTYFLKGLTSPLGTAQFYTALSSSGPNYSYGVELRDNGTALSLGWAILASSAPPTGTYVVSYGANIPAFSSTSAPSQSGAQWYAPPT